MKPFRMCIIISLICPEGSLFNGRSFLNRTKCYVSPFIVNILYSFLLAMTSTDVSVVCIRTSFVSQLSKISVPNGPSWADHLTGWWKQIRVPNNWNTPKTMDNVHHNNLVTKILHFLFHDDESWIQVSEAKAHGLALCTVPRVVFHVMQATYSWNTGDYVKDAWKTEHWQGEKLRTDTKELDALLSSACVIRVFT